MKTRSTLPEVIMEVEFIIYLVGLELAMPVQGVWETLTNERRNCILPV